MADFPRLRQATAWLVDESYRPMMRSKPTAWLSGVWLIALGGGVAFADDDRSREGSAPPSEAQSSAPGVVIQSSQKTKPKPTGQFVLGVGFGPNEGPVFGARVEQPRLFGSNHGLSLSSEISRLRQDVRLRYDGRRLLGSDIDVRAELYNQRRLLTGFESRRVGGDLSLSKSISRHTRAYIGYRREQVDIASGFPAAGFGSGVAGAGLFDAGAIAALRTGLIYDTRDRPFAPRAGTRAELYMERALPRLGSDFDLTRVGASIQHHRKLVGPFTLRLRGGASAVWSRDGIVPLSERLRIDGHDDVRGYPMGRAGPVLFSGGDALGVGGNTKLGGRAELEVPLVRRLGISAAVFYDAAVVRDLDGLGVAGNGLYQSAGVSLIWRSPIGPLRFDWAFPLGGRDRRSGPTFLFSLGQAF